MSAEQPIPVPGSAGVTARPLIRCRAEAEVNPCGAYDTEHHAAAADAGVCCQVLAKREQDSGFANPPESRQHLDVWPPFEPSDDDAPDGAP